MEKVMEVALAIKQWMAANGLTMTEMAERLDVSPQAVSAQLDGKRIFGRSNARKYADAFGFDADYLMTGRGLLIPNHEHTAPASAVPLEIPAQVAAMLSSMSATIQSQQETIAILVRNGDITKQAGPRFPAKADPPIIK